MSKVVAFRENIMSRIKGTLDEFWEVNWYDGIFDEEDLTEWAHKVPAAYVSVMSAPTSHHSTGEMNLDLRCVVVIIDQDTTQPRDADERVWDLCEKLATLANLNHFEDANSGAATKIKFQRLAHPELRREGVAVGIVEWQSALTIGTNQVEKREFIYHDGQRVSQTPRDLFLGIATPYDATGERGPSEEVNLTPTDEAFPGDLD